MSDLPTSPGGVPANPFSFRTNNLFPVPGSTSPAPTPSTRSSAATPQPAAPAPSPAMASTNPFTSMALTGRLNASSSSVDAAATVSGSSASLLAPVLPPSGSVGAANGPTSLLSSTASPFSTSSSSAPASSSGPAPAATASFGLGLAPASNAPIGFAALRSGDASGSSDPFGGASGGFSSDSTGKFEFTDLAAAFAQVEADREATKKAKLAEIAASVAAGSNSDSFLVLPTQDAESAAFASRIRDLQNASRPDGNRSNGRGGAGGNNANVSRKQKGRAAAAAQKAADRFDKMEARLAGLGSSGGRAGAPGKMSAVKKNARRHNEY